MPAHIHVGWILGHSSWPSNLDSSINHHLNTQLTGQPGPTDSQEELSQLYVTKYFSSETLAPFSGGVPHIARPNEQRQGVSPSCLEFIWLS